MSETHDEKRSSNRRERLRRMTDLLYGEISKEEIQEYERLLYGSYQSHLREDRRKGARRSDKNRRAKE